MKTKIVYMFAAAMAVSAMAFAQNADNKTDKKGTSYISLGPVGGFGHSWTSNMDNRFKPSAHLDLSVKPELITLAWT